MRKMSVIGFTYLESLHWLYQSSEAWVHTSAEIETYIYT